MPVPRPARSITLELTGSLSITQDGQPVSALTVTEGETVHFVLDNTANFGHNFFIGPADALAQNQVAGLPGVPDWTSGIQEFDYVVTAETAGLQFACTVPGHYGPMHGTFTVVPPELQSATPTAAPSDDASAAPSAAPGSPAASSDASPSAGQTITLELTGSLSITQDGQPVSALTVTEGETVHFVLDNTANYAHNFFIGPADALAQNQVAGLPGVPDWTSGIQEFDYVVTAETAGLQFACTIPGHYGPMHGTFTVVP